MNRSININNSGYVYNGDDIKQSWHIILNTVKGSDPMRPDFGCSIMDYIDKPLSVVRSDLIASIKNDLETYETRATVDSIKVTQMDLGQYKFIISGTVISSNEDIQYVDILNG